MALRRALVVDDSKSARLALKKQLEEYDLSVDLADSGEDALEFLQSHRVDVVFMDHIMPGMDGLEAVTAIKSNPITATIPVMMYTSKEGEVYVSQARALGAVDVLPKQVQPGVLFGMLLKLGLVRDRRAQQGADLGEPADVSGHGDDAQQPMGMPVPALLTRILEDQHSELRSDILKSHRSFAREVAKEVYEKQKAEQLEALEQEEPERPTGPGLAMLTGALAVAVLFVGGLYFQARSERDAIRDNLDQLVAAAEQERMSTVVLNERLQSEIGEAQIRSEMAMQELLNTLTWAMNQAGAVPYDELPLNEDRSEQISGLLSQLLNAGFAGTVRIESHLGEFCLESDTAGVYRLVDPDSPITSCALIGHPLDGSKLLSDRQSPGFARFVAESPLVNGSGIELDIIVRDRLDSVPVVQYPADPISAGEWNQVAAQNNRLVYSLHGLAEP
ncbi:MAG: response regulator [Gammaproteobacteria bacterium]|nr:response regulator [Gammaproteobacteria bacterium]